MKGLFSKVLIYIIIPVIVIGALLEITISISKNFIEDLVNQKHTFDTIELEPYGFEINSIFHYSLDSLSVSAPSGVTKIKNFNLKLNIISDASKNISITIDTVNLDIKIPKDTITTKDTANTPIPFKRFSFPISWMAQVTQINAKIDSTETNISNLVLKNQGVKEVDLNIEKIKSNFVDQTISLDVKSQWKELMLQSELKISTPKQDYLDVHLENDFDDLRIFLVEIESDIKHPNDFLKSIELPDAVPPITEFTFDGYVSASIPDSTYNYNIKTSVKTKFHDAGFEKISASTLNVKLKGKNLKTQFDIKLDGQANEKLDINGRVNYQNEKLSLQTSGITRNIIISFVDGDYKMPLNFDIANVSIENDSIYASISSTANTEIELRGKINPEFSFELDVLAGNEEPWAIDWCEGECVLRGERPVITGNFNNGVLFLNAKVQKPFAYYANPDYLETDIAITANNITFDNIIIADKDKVYNGSGQISIDGVDEYVKFELWSGDEYNSFYYNFDTVMTVTAQNTIIEELPLDSASLPPFKFLKGVVNGEMQYNLEDDRATFFIDWKTKYYDDVVDVLVDFSFDKNSYDIRKALFKRDTNSITVSAKFNGPDSLSHLYDSLEYVKLDVHYLDLGFLSSIYLDTVVTSGTLQGGLNFTHDKGLSGKLTATDLTFKAVDSNFLSIERFHLDAVKTKAIIDAKIELGKLGEWDHNLSMVIDSVTTASPQIKGSAIMNHSGVISFDTKINNYQNLDTKIKIEGPWLLPSDGGSITEITHSSVEANASYDFSKGLEGLNAHFESQELKLKLNEDISPFPIYVTGDIKDGLLNIPNFTLQNSFGDNLKAELKFDIPTSTLEQLNFNSSLFRIKLDKTQLFSLKDISGKTEIYDDYTHIFLTFPSFSYLTEDKDIGNIVMRGDGKFKYTAPLPTIDQIETKQDELEGFINIDEFSYTQNFNLDPYDRKTWIKIFEGIKNYFSSRKDKSNIKQSKSDQSKAIAATNPTLIEIRVDDATNGTMLAKSDIFYMPFTLDLLINGTSSDPIFNGTVNSIDEAYVGMKDLIRLEVDNFNISWNATPLEDGLLDVNTETTLELCTEDIGDDECPIQIDLKGTLSDPKLLPAANCGWEATPVEIYSGIILFDCISPFDDQNSFLGDGLGVVGDKALGILINTATNALGAKYIGTTEISWDFFGNSAEMEETDSSYIKVPILLDEKVKGLKLELGYAKGTGINPRYEDAYEFGIDYILPVFNSEDSTKYENMLDPELTASAKMIAKSYAEDENGNTRENNVEYNLGFNYEFKYWDFCLFNLIGNCKEKRATRKLLLEEFIKEKIFEEKIIEDTKNADD